MRALSIRQPWAWAILCAGKRIENRAWERGPGFMVGQTFLLHAAKGCTVDEYENAALSMQLASGVETPPLRTLTRGAIVGRARLVGFARISETSRDPWAVPGALGLWLSDVERITSPIPFKGALGFFEVPDGLLSEAAWEPAPGGR